MKNKVKVFIGFLLLVLLVGCSKTEVVQSDEVWDSNYGYYDLEGRTVEEFIEYCLGDSDMEPFATYINPEGDLQMEVYYDEASGIWCGIRYAVTEDEKTYGFLIDEDSNIREIDNFYQGESVDDLLSPDEFMEGTGQAISIENIEPKYEYDEEGRILSYKVIGDYTNYNQEVKESELLYAIDYVYYDNGMT